MKKYIVTTFILLSVCSLQAQVVDTAYFRVDYTPKLMAFKKQNQQAEVQDTTNEKVEFTYYIVPQRVDVSFEPSVIKFNKVTPDISNRLYRNYLKAGFGYPLTPLLEFSFHNLQSKKYSFGLNVHHFSSWAPPIGKIMKEYANYPTSDTRAHVFFKRFFKNQTFYSSIGYNHEAARFYGFKINEFPLSNKKDSLKNNFHHLNAAIGLASNYVLEEKKLKQDVRLNYDFLQTNWKDMENHLGVNAFLAYDIRWLKISGSQNYRFNLDFDYYNNKWQDLSASRNAYVFNPEFIANFTIKEYHILVGLGGVVNTYQGKTDGTIYPIAELQLGVIPSILSIYAGVTGDVKYNSFKDLLYENPFIKPHLDTLCSTTNFISIYGGVKGNLVKKLNYNVSARYNYSKNLAFFVTDTLCAARNQFDVVYHDGNVLNVCLDMNWEILKNLNLNFDANYWLYLLKDKAIPWHKPILEFSFNGQYILKEKWAFDLNFNLGFGRKALVYDSEELVYKTKIMKPILDFGVGVEYFINDRFSAFATINNLACQYYSKYYDFKNLGINAMVGITYAFGGDSIKKSKINK
ncbi:MAG TPA: hypothetical protein PK740_05965 [Bacteroidales bacterium]|nr:hypothetical protein [Bacteroidales bacterium]